MHATVQNGRRQEESPARYTSCEAPSDIQCLVLFKQVKLNQFEVLCVSAPLAFRVDSQRLDWHVPRHVPDLEYALPHLLYAGLLDLRMKVVKIHWSLVCSQSGVRFVEQASSRARGDDLVIMHHDLDLRVTSSRLSS